MPEHHLNHEILVDYAAGAAPEPVALLVAAHLTYCPNCRRQVTELEDLGGALLDKIEPAAVDEKALERLLSRLDEAETSIPSQRQRHEPAAGRAVLPRPLQGYFGGDIDLLAWKKYGRHVAEVRALPEFSNYTTRLLRIKPGKAIPAHGHHGRECTVILAGGFSDERGEYRQGDSVVVESGEVHHPVALPGGDCICLVVTEAPVHFVGPFGRLLNWFVPN